MSEPVRKEQPHTAGGNKDHALHEPQKKSTQLQHQQTKRQNQIESLHDTSPNSRYSDPGLIENPTGSNSHRRSCSDRAASEDHNSEFIAGKASGGVSPISEYDESSDGKNSVISAWQPPYLENRGYNQTNTPYSNNSPYSQSIPRLQRFTDSPPRGSTSDAATIGDDWELLEPISPPSTTPPSSTFPGTWTAALHETTSALSSVSRASVTYASAISKSGLGKAGWSIGSAVLSSTNRGALSAAGWAVDRTGVTMNELPRPVRGWLERGKRIKRARGARRVVVERMEETMRDERGTFVLETRELDAGGEADEHGPDGGDGVEAEEGGLAVEEGDGLVRVFGFDD